MGLQRPTSGDDIYLTYARVSTHGSRDIKTTICMICFVVLIGSGFFVALGGAELLFPAEEEEVGDIQLYRLYVIIEPKDGNFSYNFYIQSSIFNQTDIVDVFSIRGYENETIARGSGNLLWSVEGEQGIDGRVLELDSSTPTDMQFYWFDTIVAENVKELLPDESVNAYQWLFEYSDYIITVQLGPRYNSTTTEVTT